MQDWEKGCHNCGRKVPDKPCSYRYAWEAKEFNGVCAGWEPQPKEEEPTAER